ncbi:MAG: hypothetical protein MPEBLZ_01035 [Candidatus Methanoperedens nitroreducens]|uniref:Uncharacterized protein n=1 Tax=Candidatus Methanoperedens nitratireducens TaxID=1392998 RepID=A0A0N8KRA6_9EURY|nr:MAG: hypothetical protein MPEBLZ_01035 [Candidatus Methanoperedens sp. BLZ1]
MNNEAQNDEERRCKRLCPDCPMRTKNDLMNEISSDHY